MRARRLGTVVVAVLALLGISLIGAPAASANHDGCGGAHDEQALLAQNLGICRMTFVIDPGVGRFVTRQQLVDDAAMYDRLGYDRNFLYWSGERVISGAGHRWTHCDDNGIDNSCADDVIADGPVSHTFADDREPPLSVFGDAGGFVAKVCGNSKSGVRINDRYHPTLTGEKFHDRNRDGVRQAGEEALADWTFQIEQIRADFGPVLGVVGHATTRGDGTWSFDLVHASPGTYRVTELPKDGWRNSPAPASHDVTVPAGAENASFSSGLWGNTQTRADVAKTEFTVIDPPARIDADTPTELTVRVTLANNGPADHIDVVDTVTATSPNSDCTFATPEVVLRRQLTVGIPDTTDVTFTVTCTEPSNHSLTFDDILTVATEQVTDPDPANNTRQITHPVEVFDASDLRITAPQLACPQRTDIGVPVVCTATATLTNEGPYGGTTTDADWALDTPSDCTATVVGGTEPDEAEVAVSHGRTVSQSWTVECAQRSYHPMRATVTARTAHLHVEDRVATNDSASADDVVEVFEPADLEVLITGLVCTEREANPTASSCTATVAVTNGGPATDVASVATTLATPAADCAVVPVTALDESLVLAAGQTVVLTRGYELACSEPVRHDVVVDARVRTDEPHAEDRNQRNNHDRLVWVPIDIKPRSLPSSVSVGRQGSLPFALLSTERVDAPAQIDPGTVRFGITGTEDSVQSCAPGGEDVNDDGRPDVVCHADTLLTGVNCSALQLVATGRFRDGTRFVAQDDVNVVGCPRR
jgi:hypothetical protein